MVNDRIIKVRRELAKAELDAIFISQAENRRYLSQFTGSAGFLLISMESAILATDFRYVEQAKGQAPDFEVVSIKGDTSRWFPELIREFEMERLGFEANDLSFFEADDLSLAAHQKLTGTQGEEQIQLVPTEGLVESIRAVKEEDIKE